MPFNLQNATTELCFLLASENQDNHGYCTFAIETNNEVHMKNVIYLLFVALIVMLLSASSSTFAGKIYKWTDANGKVHYGERPPNGKAEQMKVKGTSTFGATPTAVPSNKGDAASKFLESVAAERKEKNETTDKLAKEKEISDKNCSIARRQVASLNQGGRRYEVDEKGERTYLDEVAIKSRLSEAQKKVAEWCK
jgi:hypothetical protein